MYDDGGGWGCEEKLQNPFVSHTTFSLSVDNNTEHTFSQLILICCTKTKREILRWWLFAHVCVCFWSAPLPYRSFFHLVTIKIFPLFLVLPLLYQKLHRYTIYIYVCMCIYIYHKQQRRDKIPHKQWWRDKSSFFDFFSKKKNLVLGKTDVSQSETADSVYTETGGGKNPRNSWLKVWSDGEGQRGWWWSVVYTKLKKSAKSF